ncbi:MAG: histidine kinase [Devosia sp.]
MPTLIRLIITLLFLAGLVYVGMFALVAYVQPTPKQVSIHIPARDLLGGGNAALPGSAEPAAGTAEPAKP